MENRNDRSRPKDLNSLLQDFKRRTGDYENWYLEAVETFLSYMGEKPETMLEKVAEARTLSMRQELQERVFLEALRYLDSLSRREDISVDEYNLRSAVLGDLMRLFAENVMREK
jgi:hypothetical protein